MRRLGQHSLGFLALTSVATLMLGCGGGSKPEAASPASAEAPPPPEAPGYYPGSVVGADSAPSDMAGGEKEADEEAPMPPPAIAPSPAEVSVASRAATGGAAPSPPGRASGESKAARVAKDDGSSRRRPRPELATASGVRAGEWDDNANYKEFQRWLSSQDGIGFHTANVSQRRFIV